MNLRRGAFAAAPHFLSKLPAVSLSVALAAGLAIPYAATMSARAQTAEAPAAPAAKIIRDIDVEYVGGATVAKERVLSNMSTTIGDELSPAKLDDDIASLYSSGIADNVKFFSEPMGGNGVRLIVQLQTRSAIGEVKVLGSNAISEEKILDVADITVGGSMDEAAIQEARANVQELYRKRGYPEATVSYNITAPNEQGYSTVVLSVDEGGRGVLRKVEFVGNTVFSAGELRKQMEQKKKSLWNIFSKKGRIDGDVIEDDIRRIEEHYRNHGYLNARVENASRVRVDDEKVDLVITVFEGEQYTVGQVSVSGLQRVSPDQVSPYLRLKAGEIYSGENLTNDIKLIKDDIYGVQGYADAQVTPNLSSAGPNAVNVTYEVIEGEPFTLGRVNIDGNYKTEGNVIRREVLNKPGELYDTNKVEATRARLMNMNYFESVDMIATDTLQPGVKDLNINVSEKPTGTVNFGAGFSSIDDLVGFVDVTQSNFSFKNWPSMTGGGQRFRASLKYGTERRDFIMSLTEPWFLGQRLALGGEVFYRDLFFLSDYYDQTNFGGAISLRKPITDFIYARAELRPQSVEITVDSDASEIIMEEQGDYFVNTLGLDVVFDNRDSVFLTRKGTRVSIGGEYSGLGGDVDTYGMSISAAHFVSLPFDTILSVNGGFDTIDGSDVPIFQREFLGGANDLRGFRYRDVGPKDENGEPIGGNSALYATVEYSAPVVPKVRIATFYDAGVVNTGSFDAGTSNYNSNYGVGLRLFILGGAPIRLDYGIPVEADSENDSSGRFNFTLGYRF